MSPETKEQRRLAAIMFTDMVGYSALTQENESHALELLDEYRRVLRPIFRTHFGKEIEAVGDAFFVEFQSALDAGRCAIEIQKALHDRSVSVSPDRSISSRIGLHLGDVVQRGKHVHGDGVNIAARIEPLARPGGICVSEDVARQIQNKLELPFVRLGPGELKNIKLPVDIYRIDLPWEEKRRFVERWLFGKRRKLMYAALAGIVLISAVLALVLPLTTQSRNALAIAVLPFRNLNDSGEDDYFSDGITEDVIAHLSRIGRFRVISPTSAMQYKNTPKSMRDIGNELNVFTVLQGSIRRERDSVRIIAQLIDTETDERLWTGTYDQELTHIFAIQRDVATKIAEALQTRISPVERHRLATSTTESVRAYDLYLRGRYHWNKRLPDELKQSIKYFEQAIAVDSTYALAYAGLADAYVVLGDFNVLHPRATYPRAKDAALRAMSMDDGLSEVHTSFANALMHFDWNWSRAEAEFKQAIALNPSTARAHRWLGLLQTVSGRFEEAMIEGEKAIQLDPLSPAIRADAALTLYFAGHYDRAIDAFNAILQMDPTFVVAYLPLGGAYEQRRMFSEAANAFSKASMFSRGHPLPVAALGHAYALSGRKEDALNMLELLEEKSLDEYVAPYWRAAVYMGLKEPQRALDLLELAFAERDGSLIFLQVDPIFTSIHSERRFVALVERLALRGKQTP
ncbi:MAG: tetratricopeptide repeat protein [Ignavibacteriae bacterium]|nr:tetratricopeptide repeat protein [Ignavibacteriota bacterium]